MKLNNKGWSLKEMILLCSVLFFFLLIAIFFIIRLYTGLGSIGTNTSNSLGTYSYQEIEQHVMDAGLDYYNVFYENGEDKVIPVDKLKKQHYISNEELTPKNYKNPCDGYFAIQNGESYSYIKCEKYKTENYVE